MGVQALKEFRKQMWGNFWKLMPTLSLLCFGLYLTAVMFLVKLLLVGLSMKKLGLAVF
jgi:hypothetical protein